MFQGLQAMVYKEFIQVKRDPATKFVFMIPVIQLIVFGYAIDTDVRQVPLAVFDGDRRASSRELVAKLENTDVFQHVIDAATPADVRDAIVGGRAQVGLLIPPEYSRRLLAHQSAQVQVLIDGSNNNVASQALNVVNGAALEESLRRLGLEQVGRLPLDLRPKVLFNEDMTSARFFVPGLVGVILQIVTLFLTAFSVVRERERGTMEQLMVTPVGRAALMLGKLLPFAAIGLIEAGAVLLLMVYVFGVPIAGSKLFLLTCSAMFLLPSLGLGLLISTIANNQAEAMQLGMLIMLPSILLSGFVFPRDQMPWPIYVVSCGIPVTYYLQILRGVILRGAESRHLWQPLLVLVAFGVAIMTASTLRFRKRLA